MQRLEGDLEAQQWQLDQVQEQLQGQAAEKLEREEAAASQRAELESYLRSTQREASILQVGMYPR